MNPVALIQQIRFALSEMGARNAAHEFEELCHHLAKARIAPNLVPATGPVTAAGDQGRDSESYRTYKVDGDKKVVIACTLQKEGLRGKIESDVKKILAGGRVNTIYVMTESDIAVGVRHDIQKDIREDLDAEVEILDGKWIAENLKDPDTWWITEQYLRLPSEIYPAKLEEKPETWYDDLKRSWSRSRTIAGTFAEYGELRRGVRHAITEESARGDVPFWIERLEKYAEAAPPIFARRANYEIGVASIRGLQTLEGMEPRLRTYFEETLTLDDPAALEDTQVLLTYVSAADQRGVIELEPDEIQSWRDRLEAHVTKVLEATEDAAVRANLLQTVAFLRFIVPPPYGAGIDPKQLARAFTSLREALDAAATGVLFPIDRFAAAVSVLTPAIVDQPEYEAFVTQLDDLLAERGGRASAAERARDRAIRLHDEGRLIAALREFHRIRRDWFAGDTLRGSLLAMAMIVQIYSELELPLAAKYYALALAHLALNLNDDTVRDMVSRGVLLAAKADYDVGAFNGYVDLADVGLRAAHQFEGDHPSELRHGGVDLYGLVILKGYASASDPKLDAALTDRLGALGVLEEIESVTQNAKGNPSYADPTQFAKLVAEQLGAVAFADCGSEREVAWRALGVTWRVHFANDYDTTKAAERFCAIAQIVLADLAGIDLALLPTEVVFDLSATNGAVNAVASSSNDGRHWNVQVPRTVAHADVIKVILEILAVVTTALHDISLLSVADTNTVIEGTIRDGLPHKLLPNVSYDVGYSQFMTATMFRKSDRASCAPLATLGTLTPLEHPELAWYDGPGPTYSAATAKTTLENRYGNALERIKYTLPHLLGDDQIRALIAAVRSEGWLDWRILAALVGLTVNWRVNQTAPASLEDFQKKFNAQATRAEAPSDPVVPLSEFTRRNIEFADTLTMPSTLKIWKLEAKQRTPDLPAIRRFLNARYAQESDDIPHADPFA